jgi:hypothetical protein
MTARHDLNEHDLKAIFLYLIYPHIFEISQCIANTEARIWLKISERIAYRFRDCHFSTDQYQLNAVLFYTWGESAV